MSEIYIRLRDLSDTVYFQVVFGTYSHLAWVRTEDPKSGITSIITTEDLVEETRRVLESLKSEVEFDEVKEPTG
jgi:hypothetical protein